MTEKSGTSSDVVFFSSHLSPGVKNFSGFSVFFSVLLFRNGMPVLRICFSFVIL